MMCVQLKNAAKRLTLICTLQEKAFSDLLWKPRLGAVVSQVSLLCIQMIFFRFFSKVGLAMPKPLVIYPPLHCLVLLTGLLSWAARHRRTFAISCGEFAPNVVSKLCKMCKNHSPSRKIGFILFLNWEGV